MHSRPAVTLLALAVAALTLARCGGAAAPETPPADLAFEDPARIDALREAKDREFRTDPDSPIPQERIAAFEGLDYYGHDPSLRFKVKLRRYPEPVPLRIITTSGKERPAVKVGYFDINRDGTTARLQVYSLRDPDIPPEHWNDLFLPFLDATSGEETYGAGRYLDLANRPDGWYVLDFNLACLPLCAYGRTVYRCPRTPEENRLPFPIRAGERGWVAHDGGAEIAATRPETAAGGQ